MTPEQTSEMLGEVLVHLRAINAVLTRLLEKPPGVETGDGGQHGR